MSNANNLKPAEKYLLTTEEACNYFSMGRSTFEKTISNDPNVHIKHVGCKKLYIREELEDMVKRTEVFMYE